ncbi:MAG: HD domain-containing protein [Muribaculaceae bacterium]|nr:HD domain-containing protein [Muribaculaceae bacterium]
MRQMDEITRFLEQEIVPRYDHFDAGHRREHVHHVMAQGLRLAHLFADVNPAMVLVAAAYHDLGLTEGRERHHLVSGRILRDDHRLLRWFTPQEIEVMADAAEDHRASSRQAPRTIYGRILAEADREIDADTIVRRALQYGLANYPHLDREGQFLRLMEHLRVKYGPGGYLHLWIEQSDNARRLEEFRLLLADENAMRATFDRIYHQITHHTQPPNP